MKTKEYMNENQVKLTNLRVYTLYYIQAMSVAWLIFYVFSILHVRYLTSVGLLITSLRNDTGV